jgi:type IV pilus assembly protein PilX
MTKMNIVRQQGAALIVSLLLLVAITLLAISGMKRTTQQERMTANLFDKQLSQQQVEAALLEGERLLRTQPNPLVLINNAGIYDVPNPALPDRWTQNPTWLAAANMNNGMASPASYIIEYMGDWAAPWNPDCVLATTLTSDCMSPTFRITARTVSPDGRAAIILQSIWRR